ncbi:peptidoglycan-binding domain-containing protein [Streptomyces sp. NBC_00557]|uniref:peptidoglycan-binding domain-containing protein n=1 Tax=Streptomyces sp. NBC_00557 TaxID=2975776 RepID=UPI002E8091AA|nr:peptidoglycan-binding domain-containing protein [Streptomyces sp. NBC_00557]WUC37385.1 peptidoglycan-binding protein [Streptomyces sp. NBC_00557]
MTDSEGPLDHACPECGAPRRPDRSPSCDCTARAAEALQETRTAEAAAAEDFDPLRIRPYVDFEGPVTTPDTPAATGTSPAVDGNAGPAGGRAESAGGGTGNAADGAGDPGDRAAGTGTQPHAEDLRPPDATERQPDGAGPDVRPRPRSARRAVLVSVAGAGVAVVAAAGLASGLLSYHPPTRDRAAQEVRESVPDVRGSTPASPTAPSSPAPPYSAVPTAQSSTPPPASPSAKPSASPSPTGSASGTTRPASPTASTTTRSTPAAAPVLQLGDRGPEVAGLQQRLRRLNLYGDQITGVFTRPVEDAVRTYQLARGIRGDTLGVYGPATRKSLEAETAEP